MTASTFVLIVWITGATTGSGGPVNIGEYQNQMLCEQDGRRFVDTWNSNRANPRTRAFSWLCFERRQG